MGKRTQSYAEFLLYSTAVFHMCVCMAITYSKSMVQPGKVANPALGQLQREHDYFPVPVRAREFGLARWVRPSRPVSACSFSAFKLNLVLTHGIPPDFRGGVHLVTPSYAIGSVPSLLGHAIAYRWRSLPSRYFQHAHFIPIVGVGKRGEY